MRDNTITSNTPEIPAEEWGPGYRLWQAALALLAQRGPEGTTSLVRMASHLVIILLAVTVLWLSRVQLPQWEIVEVEAPVAQTQEAAAAPAASASTSVIVQNTLVRAAVPLTLVQERPRMALITHTVQAGDTLYAIADRYGISAETLMWANNMELNPDLLRLGQPLTVLPVTGVYHTVAQNDTVESIAKQYKAKAADIANFELNQLNPRNPTLTVGQKLVVPGGSKPPVVRQVKIYTGPIPAAASRGSGRFVWPTSGTVTQGYKPLHRAIDIASGRGTQVKASDSGYVVAAGWSNTGYGNYIVIDHGNGFQTLYAHLDRFFVGAGESVAKGVVIGLMGFTGNATGSHLHFEIRQNGVNRNPFGYLP
ncbi:MAG: hypothetical protein CVU38_07030 [Chloroflexi bacterium HGW-Chloroflexi-1]|nr:MAG: hypothetical protein CVU38_07030 [Chloroflexi bacterium HGW-Chloroflexi-1]